MRLCKEMKMKMKRTQDTIVSITSLPEDLIVEIVASVASSSMRDLFNLKLTCREINQATVDNLVYKRASIKELSDIVWKSPDNLVKVTYFSKQCENMGNPDALYMRGMVEFFSNEEILLGREFLKKAVNLGHLDATYIFGLILLNEESSRQEGIELLTKVENAAKDINQCRQILKKVLRQIWVKNKIHRLDFACENTTCRNGGLKRLPRRGQWSCSVEENFCSPICKWSYELNEYGIFRR